jgi:hypothetical protein
MFMLSVSFWYSMWSLGWRPWRTTRVELRSNPGQGCTIIWDWRQPLKHAQDSEE